MSINGTRTTRPPRPPPRPFSVRRWVGYVLLGESVGFLAPTAAFALTGTAGLAPWPMYAAMIAAGAVEGSLLGLAQAAALRGTPLEVPRTRWVAATAIAAAVAWSLGMLPNTLADTAGLDYSRPATWLGVGAGAVVLLATIPVAQWIVLRRVLDRAWRWIPLTMAAWLVGLPFTLLPSPFIDERTPVAWSLALFVVAGVAMATTVALVTGLGLRRILATDAARRAASLRP